MGIYSGISTKWHFHEVAFPRSGSSSTVFRSNQNLEVSIFVEGGKPENPEKNPDDDGAENRDKACSQSQYLVVRYFPSTTWRKTRNIAAFMDC